MGNRCHFHSFYDTPGWHILKVPNLLKLLVNSVSGISFWSLLIFVLSNYY